MVDKLASGRLWRDPFGTFTCVVLVYAGIDEAGYGPMLGPLCVACAAFVLDEYDPNEGAPDLWSILDEAVCRSRRDSRKRIAIDDSKKLKGSSKSVRTHPLTHLERGVLAIASLDDEIPPDDAALFAHLGVKVAEESWYASSTPLPLARGADAMRIDASRLKRAMTGAGVRCGMLRCEAIDVEAFNEGVKRLGRKSVVNLGAAMRLIDNVWRTWPGNHPRVIVDRQGGRTRYLRELQLAFPSSHIRIIAENDEVSRYQLEDDGSRLTLSFTRASESKHLPAALASMIAKYVRELMMIRLNRFFTGHLPELKPTAGYVQDARRYVREIECVIDELGIARRSLIRSI